MDALMDGRLTEDPCVETGDHGGGGGKGGGKGGEASAGNKGGAKSKNKVWFAQES